MRASHNTRLLAIAYLSSPFLYLFYHISFISNYLEIYFICFGMSGIKLTRVRLTTILRNNISCFEPPFYFWDFLTLFFKKKIFYGKYATQYPRAWENLLWRIISRFIYMRKKIRLFFFKHDAWFYGNKWKKNHIGSHD